MGSINIYIAIDMLKSYDASMAINKQNDLCQHRLRNLEYSENTTF